MIIIDVLHAILMGALYCAPVVGLLLEIEKGPE